MSDLARVGQVAAELIEALDEDGAVTDKDRLGVVAIVVELNDDIGTRVIYRCSDNRRWIQSGLFTAAIRSVWISEADDEDI